MRVVSRVRLVRCLGTAARCAWGLSCASWRVVGACLRGRTAGTASGGRMFCLGLSCSGSFGCFLYGCGCCFVFIQVGVGDVHQRLQCGQQVGARVV